jgi:hypothetical protein
LVLLLLLDIGHNQIHIILLSLTRLRSIKEISNNSVFVSRFLVVVVFFFGCLLCIFSYIYIAFVFALHVCVKEEGGFHTFKNVYYDIYIYIYSMLLFFPLCVCFQIWFFCPIFLVFFMFILFLHLFLYFYCPLQLNPKLDN